MTPINYKYGRWGAYFFDVHTGAELDLNAVVTFVAKLEQELAQAEQDYGGAHDKLEVVEAELAAARIDTRVKQLIGLGWKHGEKNVTTFQGFLNWFSRVLDEKLRYKQDLDAANEEILRLNRLVRKYQGGEQ